MESSLPHLGNEYDRAAIQDLFSRNYTDIFRIFDKTDVSDPAEMGNADGEIAALTFSDPPTQAECQALRDKCEELADDVRALHGTVGDLIDSLQARDLA